MGWEMNGEVLDRTKDLDVKDKKPAPGGAAGILSQISDGEIDWVDLRFTDPKG